MRLYLVLFTFLLSTSNAFGFESCENFAAMYSMNTVTTDMVLEGTPVYANNYFPSEPVLQAKGMSDSGPVLMYETIITVSPKDQPTVATRYYVTLSVVDQDASCALVAGSQSIDFEN